MKTANYVLIALSVAFYLLHSWGALWHFRRVERVRAGLVALTIIWALAFAAQLAGLWPNHELWAYAWTAVPVYAAAFGLWAWTIVATRSAQLTLAFSRDLPNALIDRGPYRYVRHPFYTSYTLYWLAGSLATLTWWVAAPSIMASIFYVVAARSEERKFAASRLAGAYADYRSRTGMFLPLPGRRMERNGRSA